MSKQRFVDPFSGKEKSYRHNNNKKDQAKLKKVANAYGNNWYCFVWKYTCGNGKQRYKRCWFSGARQGVKEYSNRKIRHQRINSEEGVRYPIKGNGARKLSTQHSNWLLL